MRVILRQAIAVSVQALLVSINTKLPLDVWGALEQAKELSRGTGALFMDDIINNAVLARKRGLPLCQDTGMVVVFAELGVEVSLEEPLQQTIDFCVAEIYPRQGYRPSVVSDPLARTNTNNNTPSIVYVELVTGNSLKLDIMIKGFGSENMSRSAMLTPAQGYEGLKDFVVSTVKNAGGNPCPPIIVGVGVGGTFDYCAMLSKKALLRTIGERHRESVWAEREKELLTAVNELGIGPGGAGGGPTALAVHMEYHPTHIAGLPVAVNILCHSSRHGRVVL
ncbi:MAG: fumarate hydratase subunit alpha [Bacillota bacterium]|nr:MAG: fumarate hydratase subunit alpha [Bacillota bacterium]MBS3949058.1 fumarate hydratase [Peptococcaceae bacterium]